MLRSTTRLCGLIGSPVAHSFSPAMHNAAFAHLGLDLAYGAMDVAATDVASAIHGARALGFLGLQVTAPHKETALACCAPDEIASAVGAVNTLVFSAGGIAGTNTDVHGIDRSLDAFDAPVKHAIVVGTGGAARAALYALDRRDIAVTLVGRRARTLVVGARTHVGITLEAARFSETDLVIDSTPVGHGEGPPAWPVETLRASALVLDLVPKQSTPLTRAAKARGLPALAGDTMLLHQGVLAFERFTGRPAPVDVMRAALELAMQKAAS